MSNDSIILYIVLRQSLHLNLNETSQCVANATQHLLLKYFTWQVLGVKTKLDSLLNDEHVKMTTQWLSTQSKKAIVSADEDTWNQIKKEFCAGKDMFVVKNVDCVKSEMETTLILWPMKNSQIPEYLKNLAPIA